MSYQYSLGNKSSSKNLPAASVEQWNPWEAQMFRKKEGRKYESLPLVNWPQESASEWR